MSIPTTTVLNIYTSDLWSHVPNVVRTLEPWLGLVLVLIFESSRGKESRWYPYLKTLPESFNTLIYWTDSEVAELQASAVISKIGFEDANLTFLEQLMPVVMDHREAFVEYVHDLTEDNVVDFLLPLAHRMASVVIAYAFDMEEPEPREDVDEDGFVSDDEDSQLKGMIPMVGSMNADPEKQNVCRGFT